MLLAASVFPFHVMFLSARPERGATLVESGMSDAWIMFLSARPERGATKA